jgi:hypothetical protein
MNTDGHGWTRIGLNRQGAKEDVKKQTKKETEIPDNPAAAPSLLCIQCIPWFQQKPNHRPHKRHKIFRTRTHAALTGKCRSGGSADTRIREFIRVSRCPATHVRIADSAACHASPINFLFYCDWRWCLGGSIQSGIFLASAAHTSAFPRLRVTPFPELNFGN